MIGMNGDGLGQRDWRRMAATAGGRSPLPGRPLPGGSGLVWVYDEKNIAVPLAEVYLVRVERDTMDLIEQVASTRTDYLGKARFILPSITAEEVLLYLVEKPGYARGTFTARPGMTARVQIARETGGFQPEQVVLRTHAVDMGMPGPMDDAEFLTSLAVQAKIQPQEAGALAAKWRDQKLDDFVRFLAVKLGLGAQDQATLLELAKAKNREGILTLVKDSTRPFYFKAGFLVPAGFFAAGLAIAASRRRK